MNGMGTEKNWLEQLDLVGVSHDGVAAPVSEKNPVPATLFSQDTTYIQSEEGCFPNPSQMVEFRQTLDLKIRSSAKTKLWIFLFIHGEFLNPHDAGYLGNLIRCIDPGAIAEVRLVTERGFRGLLVLMPEPVLQGVS